MSECDYHRQVNENGIISFNKPWKFSLPDKFPTKYFWTRAGMAVAPFWSDNDIRKEGAVRYATFHSSEVAAKPEGKDWLDQVNTYIQSTQGEGEKAFNGTWVLTVHWANVHPSPHGDEDHRGISEEELDKVNSPLLHSTIPIVYYPFPSFHRLIVTRLR